MRSMKTTNLTFGPLVNSPVKMYKATDDGRAGELEFHQHHGPTCHGRIRMARTCEGCGEMVEYRDIIKGTVRNDVLVVVTDAELDELAEDVGPNIDIVQFCQNDEWDPMMLDGGTYYLAPDGATDGYSVIRAKMVETDRVGIVRFIMKTKIKMGVLRVLGNVLVLQTLVWFDQVRSARGLPGVDNLHTPTQQELDVAQILMDNLTREFDPTEFGDGFSERLIELVDAKAAGGEVAVSKPQNLDAPKPSGLLAQLQASVKATKPVKKTPGKKRGVA